MHTRGSGAVVDHICASFLRDVHVHQRDETIVVNNYTLAEGTVLLAPDVREYFSDSQTVNEALRSLIHLTGRRTFSDAVLKTPVDAVKQYWMRNMRPDNRPPVVKETDAAVIAFVASSRGAVGYVSETAELPAGVRAVSLQ